MNEVEKAMEEAHQDYEKRKKEVITKLITLRDYGALQWHERKWCDQAIEFIREREI